MLEANQLEATNLVEDILLPDASNDEIYNRLAIPRVCRWVLTRDSIAFEQHKNDGLPVFEAGELYALGLAS